jgi:HAD superfamily hydrolase (TIGR01509 family)
MDGTLVDTEPYWMATEREIVASFGHEWPDHHAHAIVGFDLLDAGAYIAEHGPVPLEPREIVDRLLDGVIEKVRREIPWRPGARELLADLRAAGVPCALVTMSWRRFVEPVLAELPGGSFDAIVTGDEVSRGKPHPEPYLLAAHELGVAPDQCVAIEDSPTGVRSAVDAGCRVIGVPNVRSIPERSGATIVRSLRSLDAGSLWSLTEPAVTRPAVRGRRSERLLRRRRTVFAALGLVTIAAVGAGLAIDRTTDDPPPPPTEVPLDAWAPYWTLDETVAELPDRLGSIREVSPFWFQATGATTVGVDPNAPSAAAEEFMDAARDSNARIVPSIVDAMPAGGMADVLADPTTRSAHVDTIVDFVLDGDYAGVDLDYEQFAFADGRDTWDATRPDWVAFVTELAERLHERGRTITVSIPPVYDGERTDSSGYWVYDHGAIAEVVDSIRIMAYDYSTSEPGPIAPVDWVRRAVEGTAGVVADDSVLVLGIPVYGYNWVVSTAGTCPADAEGRTSVTTRSVHDLLERRGGTPVRDATTGEWSFTYELEVDDGTTSCTQSRQVNYVDGDGAVERIQIAREARLGGVALWALGYEDDAVWELVDAIVRLP